VSVAVAPSVMIRRQGRRAHHAARAIDRDPDQEGPQRTVAAEPAHRPRQIDERVVDDVLGGRHVAEEAAGERADRLVVGSINGRDRCWISPAQGDDELVVARYGHLDRTGEGQRQRAHDPRSPAGWSSFNPAATLTFT